MGRLKKVIVVMLCVITIALCAIVNTSAHYVEEDGSTRLYFNQPWSVWLHNNGDDTGYVNITYEEDIRENSRFYTYDQNMLATTDQFYIGEYMGCGFADYNTDGWLDLYYDFEFRSDVDDTYVWNGNVYHEVGIREVRVWFYNAYESYINPLNIDVCSTYVYDEDPTAIQGQITSHECFYFTFHNDYNSEAEYDNLNKMNNTQHIGVQQTLRTTGGDFQYQLSVFPSTTDMKSTIYMDGFVHDIATKTYQDGYKYGKQVGYDEGWNKAYEKYYEQNVEEFSIIELMNGIVTAPVVFLKEALNFEIFGVNLSGFATFLLSAILILFIAVTIIRMVL